MVNIQNIAEDLIKVGQSEDASFKFDVTPIPSDVEVLKINVEDREEIPLFVSVSEEQILCMAYLFGFDEVKKSLLQISMRLCSMRILQCPFQHFQSFKIVMSFMVHFLYALHSKILRMNWKSYQEMHLKPSPL